MVSREFYDVAPRRNSEAPMAIYELIDVAGFSPIMEVESRHNREDRKSSNFPLPLGKVQDFFELALLFLC